MRYFIQLYIFFTLIILIISCSSNEIKNITEPVQEIKDTVSIDKEDIKEENAIPTETIDTTTTVESEEDISNEKPMDSTLVEKKIQIVLLAGQSNMSGHGNYDILDDQTKDRITNASETVFLSNYRDKAPIALSYYDYTGNNYSFKNHFGPELLAGATLAEKYPEREFLFIKLAMGGTSLYGAWNANWSAEQAAEIENEVIRQRPLYSWHLEHIKANLSALEEQQKSYEIIGLLWFQGEHDSLREAAANSYLENLTALVNAYRNDVSVQKMPVVIGQINSTYGVDGGAARIRKAMVDYVSSDKHSKLIYTKEGPNWDDYPKHEDNIHYNAEGLKSLGEKFGQKLIELIE
ncbi:hypothetical protein D9O36_01380 [Zobellia amurskyensis]|uniref:Sialate O-acetylesterase domain-containing protein n=1 Tax=Zobellia amurskyensis TaxID=248905 RepID=A0A7X2ZQE0_9FLAO|nr:sialate O-acetylesterase [Zobellia amurskyensis]MUH34480.1 hypothetical protein [Zobellia amurskyensis]